MSQRREKPITLVTTSWDDGHPLDIRMAELLASYGVPSTFYVPVAYHKRPVMTKTQLSELVEMRMEVGSHTLTHPILTELQEGEIFRELRESRKILEDTLGRPVTSFCYPKGKFNDTVRSLIREAGYRLARTTLSFRTELTFDPTRMPVSCQFARQPRSIYIKHALKESNLTGIVNWWRFCGLENDLVTMCKLIFDHVLSHGGMFHVWGHSWEIEELGLWSQFEEVLKYISRRSEVSYVTNTEVLDAARR